MAKFTVQKLKRLQAMSVSEIAYRLFRVVKDKADKRRILSGELESSELFVSKLAGQAETLEEKFKAVFTAFQNRTMFAWQKMDQQKLIEIHREHFVNHRHATISAADEFVNLEFEIFGLTIKFDADIDWHYDPLLQKSIPLDYCSDINYYSPDVVKEVKYVWELNRCQHFVALGKAFYLTNDEQYARALVQQWTSWIEKNPYKMGINWTSSLECAFRLISWTWALAFVRQSGHVNAGLYAKLLQSINAHARFIENHLSRYSSANNHLLGEALGLIYAGSYFPEIPMSERWRTKGFQLFFDEFIRQVHEDGVTAEQTTYYQKYVFDFAVLTILAAERQSVTVPQQVWHRLERMADFYAAIGDKNGNIPNIGDDDGGRTLNLDHSGSNPCFEVLSTAAVLFNRPDLNTELSETMFWLLQNAIESFQKVPTPKKDRKLVRFQSGGYIVFNQSTPVEQKMVFDCGPLGLAPMAAHGHADALSLTLSVDGQPVLIDCGTWLYLGAGEERQYFRGTSAHNTVVIDKNNQSDMLGPFQWGRKATSRLERVDENEEKLVVQASHDGYRNKRLQHRRRVEAEDGMWTIRDSISGVGNHQIDVYFHCLASVLKQRGRAVVIDFSTFTVEFQFDELETDTISINKAWHSFRFGEREQHGVIHRQVTGSMPLELTTIIKVYA